MRRALGDIMSGVEHRSSIFSKRLLESFASPSGRALLALLLVLAIGLIFHADGAFYRLTPHRDALRQSSVFGILACEMTLVIITGGIDLSVGSVLALVAVCVSRFSIQHSWPSWCVAPACLMIGAACGAASGLMTAWGRIQPFIATLAMMVFTRGLAKMVSGGMKISSAVKNEDGSYHYVELPQLFGPIDSQVFDGNLSVVTVIFLVFAIMAWVMLARHRWGRQLFAIGGNEEAARLSGVPTRTVKLLAYTAAGLTIGYLDKILSINAVPEASRLMLTGVIIIVAVLTQRRRSY